MAGHFKATAEGMVPLTVAEEAQYDADQTAGQAAAQAQQVLDVNAATMTDRVSQALTNLENAAASWGTLTPAQKDQATLLTVRVVCRLARLVLRKLDTAT